MLLFNTALLLPNICKENIDGFYIERLKNEKLKNMLTTMIDKIYLEISTKKHVLYFWSFLSLKEHD